MTVNVSNTGNLTGAEAVQLYIKYPDNLNEPPKNLKGFQKKTIAPNSSAVYTLNMTSFNFQFWNSESDKYDVQAGRYTFMAARSSADVLLTV